MRRLLATTVAVTAGALCIAGDAIAFEWVSPALPVQGAPSDFRVPSDSCMADLNRPGCPSIKSASYTESSIVAPVAVNYVCVVSSQPAVGGAGLVAATGAINCPIIPGEILRVDATATIHSGGRELARDHSFDTLLMQAVATPIGSCVPGVQVYETRTVGTVYIPDHATMTATTAIASAVVC